MRVTSFFLAAVGFAIPAAHAASPIPEEAVKRMVAHQMCVRECDNGQLRALSSGVAERQARRAHMACQMRCNDEFTGRRAPVASAATETAN
jgi:hypothetical protein